MFGSFFKQIFYIIIGLIIFTIMICVLFIPCFYNNEILEKLDGMEITISPSGFVWPIPRLY